MSEEKTRKGKLPEAQPEEVLSEEEENRGNQKDYQPRKDRSPSGVLPEDDPFWTFGSPPDTWGSTVKKGDDNRNQKRFVPQAMLMCSQCGVKVERKKAHGDGRVRCPMCGRWMQLQKRS